MTYPAEEHTADVARWANFWGFTYTPENLADPTIKRAKAIWSTDSALMTSVEVWDLATRTFVSATTLDTSQCGAPYGSQPYYGLTDGGTVYAICGTQFGVHLASWSSYGAGIQVDHGEAYGMAGCVALGGTIYMTSWATQPDGMVFSGSPTAIDTLALSLEQWQIKAYVMDGDGQVWCVGGGGDLDPDRLAFMLVDGSGYFKVTMPVPQSGSITQVSACFSTAADCFVVYFGESTLATVSRATGALIASIAAPAGPYDMNHVVSQNQDTTRNTIILDTGSGFTEYALPSLAVVRTYAYSLWGYSVGEIQQGAIYDPRNNAMIVGKGNANEDFAWLFFPSSGGPSGGRFYSTVRTRYGDSRLG